MAFETIVSDSGGSGVIILKNLSTNTFAEIYAFGALLNKFCAHNSNELVDVVEGFSSPLQATAELAPFFKSAKLSPYACRVKDAKYTFGEKEYQLKKYLTQHDAIHGVLFNAVFTISAHGANDDACWVCLEYVYSNSDEGYPFRYKCSVEYKLAAGNALSIKTTVTNLDNKLMPVVDGWHPYFTLGSTIDHCQLEFQSKEVLQFDDHLVPTGKLFPYQEFGSLRDVGTMSFDTCFTVNFAECQPMCVFRSPEKKVQVEFYPSSDYPYLQIYTPAHRRSIAIENLSAAPDAFNNGMGLKVLKPGEAATFSTKFVITFL